MACSNSGVLRTSYNQLTGGQRVALLAEATIYGGGLTQAQPKFKSSTQYLAYRKAQTIARSTNGPGPVPSVIVTDLQATYRDPRSIVYTDAFDVLANPSTTVINSTGQGTLWNVYWKVSDTTAGVWASLPNLKAVHQITSITLSYYSGFNRSTAVISDARFTLERDTNPLLNSFLLFYAYQKRVVPPQVGDAYALGSPDQMTAGPITYPNTSTTITNPAFLRALFGNGTDTIDKTKGFQFYWFTGYSGTAINNSQINEFVINYTYTECPAIPYNLPSAPVSLRVESGDGTALVTWLPPVNGGGGPILYYTVTATPVGGGDGGGLRSMGDLPEFGSGFVNGEYYPRTAPSPGVVIVSGPTSPLLITGLDNGTTYTFTVSATTGAGESPALAAPDRVTPLTLPGSPQSLSAISNVSAVDLTWSAPEESGGVPITGYRITRSPGEIIMDISESPFRVTGLANGTAYTFSVRTRTSHGLSSATTAVATPYGYPTPPQSFSATPENEQILLSWISPFLTGGSPIQYYEITVNDVFNYKFYPSQFLSHTVPNLVNGNSYSFSIVAVNRAGYSSAPATIASATPRAVPDPPAQVTVEYTGGQGGIRVGWQPGNNRGSTLESYTITSSSNKTTLINNPAAMSATITDLSANIDYTFTVSAKNNAGPSAPSQPSPSIRLTVPTAPLAVTASNNNGAVTVSWSPPTSTGGFSITGYVVTYSGGHVDISGAGVTSTIINIRSAGSYAFTVAAINALGPSVPPASSNTILLTVPSAPLSVSALAASAQATVSWSSPTSTGGFPITGYGVTSSPGGYTVDVSGTLTQATVAGLTNGVPYTFTVVARTVAGSSTASAATSAVTPYGPPSPPTQVMASFDSANRPGKIIVRWTAPVGTPIATYTVSCVQTGTQYSVAAPALTLDVSGLALAASYSFTVVAATAGNVSSGPSDPSNLVLFGPPLPPTGVSAVPGDTTALVSWTLPVTDGGYPILYYTARAVNPNDATGTVIQSVFGPAFTSMTMTGLTNNVNYIFTVLAGNGERYSEWSLPSVYPLSAPRSVTAVPKVQSAIVSWLPPISTGGLTVLYYLVNTRVGGVSVVSGTTLTTTVTGLVTGVSYYFTVVAVTATAEVESQPSLTVVPALPPSPPLSVTGVSENQRIAVNWTPGSTGGSPITSYTITSNPAGFSRDVSGTVTSVVVTGLTLGYYYRFYVIATNAFGSSFPAPALSSAVFASVPSPPSVVAVPQNQQVTLQLTQPPNNSGLSIARYRVTTNPGASTLITTNAETSIIVPGLTNGTQYYFTVEAYNAIGYSLPSSSATTIPYTTPGPPIIVSATRGNGSVTIDWTPPVNNGGSAISSYTIQSTPSTGDHPASAAATSLIITGLTNGTSYTFTVIANNIAGPGVASPASAAVTPAAAPSAPTGVGASNTNVGGVYTYASVSWNRPANNGSAITNYYVSPYDTQSGTYLAYTNLSGAAITPDWFGRVNTVIGGLVLGRTYRFGVRALNNIDLSVMSTHSEPVTIPNVPGVPTIVSASLNGLYSIPVNPYKNGLASVSWIVPNSNGTAITSYEIRHHNPPGGGYVVTTTDINDTPFNGQAYADVYGLLPGQSYNFTIVARNGVGPSVASAFSSQVTVQAVPDAPTNVTATIPPRGAWPMVSTVSWTQPFQNSAPNSNGLDITEITINVYIIDGNGTTEQTYVIPISTQSTSGSYNVNIGYYFRTFHFTVSAKNQLGYSSPSDWTEGFMVRGAQF